MRPQITRLLVVFGVAIASLVVARHYLIPPTFGKLGHYRAAAVDTVVAHKVKYAGHEVCALCHEAVAKLHDTHRHRNVACEVCHGAAAGHADAPTDIKPPAPRQRAACPLCHNQ